jgi:hypothetical protein
MAGLTGGSQFFKGRIGAGTEEDPSSLYLTNIPQRARESLGPQVEAMPAPRGLIPIEQRQAPQDPRSPQQERENILAWGRENRKSPAEITEVLKLQGVETIKPETPIAAAKTIETADGIFQWNPKSQLYDIKVGKGRGGAGGVKEQLAKLKLSAVEKKESLREESKLMKAKIISGKSAKALGQTGFFTTGFIGNVLSAIPGTPAYDLDKTIDTIKANLGFEELASMRAASPTGGALGAIAVRELEFLQRAMDALEQGQTEEQFREALTAVKTHYDNVIRNIEQGKKLRLPTGGAAEPAAAGGDLTPEEQAELAELQRRYQ